LDNEAIDILREEIRCATTEVKELRAELQKTSHEIVGWDSFNKYCADVKIDFKLLDERVTKVEKVCESYKVEREHLVDNEELVRSTNVILDRISSLEKSLVVADWSLCMLKRFISSPLVQLIIAVITVPLGGSFALPLSGRLYESGYITKTEIMPAAFSIFFILFVLIVIVPVVYVRVKKA